jgi:hypothetical protein
MEEKKFRKQVALINLINKVYDFDKKIGNKDK